MRKALKKYTDFVREVLNFYYLCRRTPITMNNRRRLSITIITCLMFSVIWGQTPATDEAPYPIHYEASQTDYGYFGTTDALFSKSETIICTFSLTQNKPQGNKIFPTMLSIWLHADAFATKSQELLIKQIAQAGTRQVDGQFRHKAELLLQNDERVELNFSINNLTEDYTHHTVMLTAPISMPDNQHNSAMYGELATKLRRYNIVTITIANTTLNLQQMGFESATCINGICKELMLAGCDTEAFNTLDSREADDFDVSGFRQTHGEKSIDDLVFHALGCFPQDIRDLKPTVATDIIRRNTDWYMDERPDYSALEFTKADGYDFTYHGLRVSAEMCWEGTTFVGYNYYFQLSSKEKRMARAAYQRMCDELEALGFLLTEADGDRGDKDPQKGTFGGYNIHTCYYQNVHDEYVIQLRVEI